MHLENQSLCFCDRCRSHRFAAWSPLARRLMGSSASFSSFLSALDHWIQFQPHDGLVSLQVVVQVQQLDGPLVPRPAHVSISSPPVCSWRQRRAPPGFLRSKSPVSWGSSEDWRISRIKRIGELGAGGWEPCKRCGLEDWAANT